MKRRSKQRLGVALAVSGALALILGASAYTATGAAAAQTISDHNLSEEQIDMVVERTATLLKTSYVFSDVGARYAAMLRENLAGGTYRAISNRVALAARLTADLQAVVPDGHLRLRAADDAASPGATPGPSEAEAPREVAPGIIDARWIEPGVAYIKFRRFSDDPAAERALVRFLATFRGARALIIDARDHRGGTFPMMGILCDRLFAKPRLLADMDVATSIVDRNGVPFPVGPELRASRGPAGMTRFQHWAVPVAPTGGMFRTPVYYLTSHRTFSAAEHMAMVLKTTGRATLIGEATGGGNHFGGTEDLGAGMSIFLPIGRTSDPATGKDWERDGVAPHIRVSADVALQTALNLVRSARR